MERGTQMKTVKEEVVGKALLRLLETADGYVGALFSEGKLAARLEDVDPDLLWRRLRAEVGKAGPNYFGYDGARARFLRLFAGGFSDSSYLAHERDYKCAARDFLREALPLERAAQAGPDDCRSAMQAFGRTNLLSQFEAARVRDVLKGADGASFLRSAAALTHGDVAAGLAGMVAAMRAHGSPSWPMATYLPFLWRPETQMFLKPQVTQDFAERVGHRFCSDYAKGFVPGVYESLLEMSREAEAAVADLGPRDRIDIQSFVWVVGAYDEPAPPILDQAGSVHGSGA